LINLEKRNDQIGSVCKVESESDEENLTEIIEGEDILTIEPMEENNNEENNN
jgi:DNA gyrase subunit A